MPRRRKAAVASDTERFLIDVGRSRGSRGPLQGHAQVEISDRRLARSSRCYPAARGKKDAGGSAYEKCRLRPSRFLDERARYIRTSPMLSTSRMLRFFYGRHVLKTCRPKICAAVCGMRRLARLMDEERFNAVQSLRIRLGTPPRCVIPGCGAGFREAPAPRPLFLPT